MSQPEIKFFMQKFTGKVHAVLVARGAALCGKDPKSGWYRHFEKSFSDVDCQSCKARFQTLQQVAK